MKAKVFVSTKKAEVRLPQGGKAIVKAAKESLEDFKVRAIAQIAADNLIDEAEVQLQMVDAKAVKKFSDEQVTEQIVKEAANQKSAKFALLAETLELREVALPEFTAEMIAEAKAAGKPAKEAKAPKEPKDPNAPVVLKDRMTIEEAEALKDLWNTKKTGQVKFLPRKGTTEVAGTIVGVVIDKRVNMVLVRIKDEAGKIYHKTPESLGDHTAIEIIPVVKPEAKAKKVVDEAPVAPAEKKAPAVKKAKPVAAKEEAQVEAETNTEA